MEVYTPRSIFDRRPITISTAPAVKWFKEWVPQHVVTGGKCFVLKWVTEVAVKALKAVEKSKEFEAAVVEREEEATSEVLFLCSYEGCGRTFIDVGDLRKHSHVHGEMQYVCHYENCSKKFSDSSKLKRHFLTHTGERDFYCPHEGCGKAFLLEFNLRSHMKTHFPENYHLCPSPECGKRFANEYKLKKHVMSHHEKENTIDVPKYVPPPENAAKGAKSSLTAYGSGSSERRYSCPQKGCQKAYIHAYKLNLHLRREHPGDFPDENVKKAESNVENEMKNEGNDQRGNAKVHKQRRPKPNLKLPPSKIPRQIGKRVACTANVREVKKPPVKEGTYEEDSEETEEEDCDNIGNRWKYKKKNVDDDDEETE